MVCRGWGWGTLDHGGKEKREGRKDDWVERGSDCSAALRNLILIE